MFEQSSLKLYGEHFYNMGLNISLFSKQITKTNFLESNSRLKIPMYDWKKYQFERQPFEIFKSYNRDISLGIGIILGFDGIIAIDIDGCIDENVIPLILDYLSLPLNYQWVYKTGSRV